MHPSGELHRIGGRRRAAILELQPRLLVSEAAWTAGSREVTTLALPRHPGVQGESCLASVERESGVKFPKRRPQARIPPGAGGRDLSFRKLRSAPLAEAFHLQLEIGSVQGALDVLAKAHRLLCFLCSTKEVQTQSVFSCEETWKAVAMGRGAKF